MNPLVERLGWVLVHSLWQFALVALLAGAISRAMRRSSSAARYGVHVVAMGVMVVVPLVTWLITRDDLASRRALAPGPDVVHATSPGADALRLTSTTKFEDPTPDAATNTRRAGGVSPLVMETSLDSETTRGLTPPARHEALSWSQRAKTALHPWLMWIVAVWCIGVAVCSLRPLFGWHMLWRLKRVGVSPASEEVLATLRRVAERLQLRRAVTVLQSTLAQVPIVVGYLRPVVLLPVSLMTSLPAEQLEAILAHELAHVRRHDFVVNLLQTLVETFFFYHPAVWWLSHQIRVEREHCCDDLVVASFGNRIEYGRALLAIEELRGRSTVLALGVADGSLLARIRRIVGIAPEHAVVRLSDRWLVAFVTLGCLLTIALGTFISSASSQAELQMQLAEDGDSAGRGSPDPALDPTAGLPNAEQDTKSANDTNGDLRSKPAAGSGDPRRAQVSAVEARILEELERTTSLTIKALTLSDVIVLVAKQHHIPIIIDVAALSELNVRQDLAISRTFKDVKLRNALKIILEDFGEKKLALVIEDDVLKITADKSPEAAEKIKQANRRIEAALREKTEIAFENLPLSDVVSYLSDYHDITIQLHPSAQEAAETPITSRMFGVEHADALPLILHQAKLSSRIDQGVLLIATPDEIRKRGGPIPRSFDDDFAKLQKADASVRWMALLNGSPEKSDLTAIPRLAELLGSDDVVVQRLTARALVTFGSDARVAQSGLEKLTRSSDGRVAYPAWQALIAIGRKDFSTLPFLLSALDRKDETLTNHWLNLFWGFDAGVWQELVAKYPKLSVPARRTVASTMIRDLGDSLGFVVLAMSDSDVETRRRALRRTLIDTSRLTVAQQKEFETALVPRLKDADAECRVLAAGHLLSLNHSFDTAVNTILAEASHEPGRDVLRRCVASTRFLFAVGHGHFDEPCRSESEATRNAARQTLAVICRNYQLTRSDHVIIWGPIRGVWQTRLTSLTEKPQVGEPLKLKLELLNAAKPEPMQFTFAQPARCSLVVIGPDGREMSPINRERKPSETIVTAEQHKPVVLIEELDLAAEYSIKQPGTYLVQWTQDRPGEKSDDGKSLTPNSNVLTVEVAAATQVGARAGRGSPDPALNPTAGLPDSEQATKETNNTNGDQRSNPAAGSGDPRRAQAPNEAAQTPASKAESLAPIEGEVIDSVTGKPIAGATVRFRFGTLRDGLGNNERLAELVFRNVGRFTFKLPEAVKGQTNDLFVERIAEHPDYQISRPGAVPLHLLFNKEPNHAHAFIRKVELVPGKIVSGQVLDIDGRPAKGIAIFTGRNPQSWQTDSAHKTTTDANGRYRLVVPDGDRGRIFVIPNHAAAVSRGITPEIGEQPVFQLQRGTRFFGRVTDAKGRGVAGVAIRANGSSRVPPRYAMTDADGRYSLPPCQYGQYVVELFDEGRFPDLPKDGVRLPDVYLHQLVDLPKTALAEQQLDFKPTESVRMTARYTTSDDQPVSGRTLSVNGAAGKASWWGRLREVTDQPGLYELRVPRGFEGRIDQNADLGGFLRIIREGPNSSPTSAWSTTKFDKDGVSFHVRSLKATSITLRATHNGQPVKIAGALSTPQFADQKAADEAGARLPSNQFLQKEVGQLWFDVHPDIDLLLKLNVPGFKPWQSTVKVTEGEDRMIDVALEADKANDAQAKVESKPAEPQKGNESLADQTARSEEVFERKVSLDVKELPLREALAKLAQAARVPLKLDEPALKKAELDLEEPVTVAFKDEPLSSALGLLIDWNSHPGVFRELRGGALSLSTIEAKQERTEQALPDWLKPPYNHGLLANIDDDNQVFSIYASGALTDELLARFKTLPKLRELDIGYTKTITAAGLAHLAQLTALEKLTLSSLSAAGERLGDEALKHIVGLKSLRELHLHECGTTDAGIRLLEQMPQLTHLDVYQEGRLTDAAIASIAKLKRLKHLGLNAYVGSQELGWMRFSKEATKSLAGLQELEHLHLVGQGISSETLQFSRLKSLSLGIEADDACAARIAECRQLQSLQLVFTSITDDGLKAISGLTELKRLNIDSHIITDTGIGHVKTLPKLDHLSLRASKLTDESLAHIAEIKSLTRLDINGSGRPGFVIPGNLPQASFTVSGLLKLKVLPNLRTLWLTNFSSSGGYSALKELKQLTELTFMMADLSSTDFSILEEALPNTRITSATGGGGLFTEPKRKKRAAR